MLSPEQAMQHRGFLGSADDARRQLLSATPHQRAHNDGHRIGDGNNAEELLPPRLLCELIKTSI